MPLNLNKSGLEHTDPQNIERDLRISLFTHQMYSERYYSELNNIILNLIKPMEEMTKRHIKTFLGTQLDKTLYQSIRIQPIYNTTMCH